MRIGTKKMSRIPNTIYVFCLTNSKRPPLGCSPRAGEGARARRPGEETPRGSEGAAHGEGRGERQDPHPEGQQAEYCADRGIRCLGRLNIVEKNYLLKISFNNKFFTLVIITFHVFFQIS